MSFNPGDRVFAKIKGFSNWPARINPLPPDVTVPKGKLPVFFYGTYQVSFVPIKNVVSYEQFKEKWGKPKSNAQFMTAIDEIESNPGVLMLGEDPGAETFLSQFYTFKKGGSWNSKRRRISKVATSKKDSPVMSLSSTKSDITTETSDALSTNDSKWDNNGTTESGVVDTLSEVDDDEMSTQDHCPNSSPAHTRDDSFTDQCSHTSVEVAAAGDDREARKVARKLIKKAEKKALKKAAKREAKRIARESKRTQRRARREAKRGRRRDSHPDGETAECPFQTSGDITMDDIASEDSETEPETATDLDVHELVADTSEHSVSSNAHTLMDQPTATVTCDEPIVLATSSGTSPSLTLSPKGQPSLPCSQSPSMSLHSLVKESPPSLEHTDLRESPSREMSPSPGNKNSPPSLPSPLHSPFLTDEVAQDVQEEIGHAANDLIQESSDPQESLNPPPSPSEQITVSSPEADPIRTSKGRKGVKQHARGLVKAQCSPAGAVVAHLPAADSEPTETVPSPTTNVPPVEASSIAITTANNITPHQLDLTADESSSPLSPVSHLKHVCHELKGCLVRGHEQFQLAVESLVELATLQVRLPQLAQARELMDCVKKCRRHKLSSEVRGAAEKVLQHFQAIRSQATKEELDEAHLLLMALSTASAQLDKSQPLPPHPTSTISSTHQPPTAAQASPEAQPTIPNEPENLAADLEAKVDDVLSRIRATDERMAAAAARCANTSNAVGSSTTGLHKPASTVGHTIRASAVAAAAAHMHDEEDEEEVMSRIELVAAFQAASKEVSQSPHEEQSADNTPFKSNRASLSPPVDLDLDSRIEMLRTSNSSSSKVTIDPVKHTPKLSSPHRATRGNSSSSRPQVATSNSDNMDSVPPPLNSIAQRPDATQHVDEASVETLSTSPEVVVEKDDELYDLLGV